MTTLHLRARPGTALATLRRITTTLAALVATTAAQAATPAPAWTELPDPVLLPRLSGSTQLGHQTLPQGTASFYEPKIEKGYDPDKEIDTEKPVAAEGKVSRLVYIAPAGKSAAEVHGHYTQLLREAGMKVATSVDGTKAWWDVGTLWRNGFSNVSAPVTPLAMPMSRGGHYLYGTVQRGDSVWSVSVLTADASPTAREHAHPSAHQAVAVTAIQIVEGRPVPVAAAEIQRALASNGHVALPQLAFEPGKAHLAADARGQLEQIATLLKQDESLNLYVVAHTDNQGTLQANLGLSQQRAQAVVSALTREHAVAARRLTARGLAQLAPLAGNDTLEGQQRNQRLELVAQ